MVPYMAKFSRGETFAVLHPTANVLRRIVTSHRHSLLRDAATANVFPRKISFSIPTAKVLPYTVNVYDHG